MPVVVSGYALRQAQDRRSLTIPPHPTLSQWERVRKGNDPGSPVKPGMTGGGMTAKRIGLHRSRFRLFRCSPGVGQGRLVPAQQIFDNQVDRRHNR